MWGLVPILVTNKCHVLKEIERSTLIWEAGNSLRGLLALLVMLPFTIHVSIQM